MEKHRVELANLHFGKENCYGIDIFAVTSERDSRAVLGLYLITLNVVKEGFRCLVFSLFFFKVVYFFTVKTNENE